MKRQQERSGLAWIFVLSVLLASVWHLAYSESERFSFDTLYPKNSCTKAAEQCLNIWGTYDQLLHKKSVSPVHFTRALDRSIGQLVLAQHFLQSAPKGEKKPSIEQVHYLSRAIGTVEDRFNKLQRVDADRSACLKDYIGKVKKMVEQKIRGQ